MNIRPIKHQYHTQLEWLSGRKGILRCTDKPDIRVACAPEFGGHHNIWSPEDLFVGMIETCTMATFFWLCDKRGIDIASYESDGSGTAQAVGTSMRFTSIAIKVKIGMSDANDKPDIEGILQEISKWCLISNSIKPEVKIDATLFFDDANTGEQAH
jgi:organic hydroperoxide reductase OsmC/OhrA